MLEYFLVASSAIILSLCFTKVCPGFLSIIALLPLKWAIDRCKDYQAKSLGFIWGLFFFLLLLWWLIPTISTYGALPKPLAAVVLLALCSYLALYPSLWAHLFKKLCSLRLNSILLILAGSSIWILLEYIRSLLFSGFPWGAIGYSLAPYPLLIQTADIWGVYGIGFFVIFVNLCLSFFLDEFVNRKIQFIKSSNIFIVSLVLLSTFSFVAFYGLYKKELQIKKGLFAVAVQGSIDQSIKWNPSFAQFTVERYKSLTKAAKKSFSNLKFVVWPETSMPFYFQEESLVKQDLLSFAQKESIYILLGSPSYTYGKDSRPRYLNSAFLISPKGKVIGKYDKQHLVPFGEYMPFGKLTEWARNFLPTAGDFISGTNKGPIGDDNISIGVMICFESIFPYISRQEVMLGADILAVITNDAWFGKTPAPWQHANMAIFRAVETRRWLIRAANTGISRIIAPNGEIVAESHLFKPEFIGSKVERLNKKTFYVKYGPYWFLAFNLLIVIIALGKAYMMRKEKML